MDKIIFEGMTSVSALIKAARQNTLRRKIIAVYFSSDKLKKEKARFSFLKHASAELGFPLRVVSSDEVDEMTTGKTHGGIFAEVTDAEYSPLSACESISKNGFAVIIEGVEDPYSLGYAARALYACGADTLIIPDRLPSGADSVLCKSSAGASELIDLRVSDSKSAIELYKSAGYRVACAEIRDAVPCNKANLKKPLLLVIGGEKRGISSALLALCDFNVKIPYGVDFMGSLSTASATAILAYEVLRQNIE